MAMRYYAPFPGGEPHRPRGPHALRIGDAERDAAAADLGEHYAAGRLNLDELNLRLDAVFSSKTFGQLTRIMADLPGPGRLPWHGWGRSYAWGPDGIPYYGGPYQGPRPPMAEYRPRGARQAPTPSDRAARFAAISLLLIAMLIWLFTALLFARHGQAVGTVPPPHPFGQYGQFGQYANSRP
jgi:hypothetical protein